jgi:hypothetical protein
MKKTIKFRGPEMKPMKKRLIRMQLKEDFKELRKHKDR